MIIGISLKVSILDVLPHCLPLIIMPYIRKCPGGLIKLLSSISLLGHQGNF